jgi:glyoxylase-like metal-dependent hydrolase (beta-lactamase superfamily II)
MKKVGFLLLLASLLATPVVAANYEIQRVADGVYAAIATPGGKAASNALIIVDGNRVILAGAHFVPEGISELVAEIGKLTTFPLKYIILTHHHRQGSYSDFDFPADAEIITSWQSWQAMAGEPRELKNPLLLVDRSLTLRRWKQSIILNNTDLGHSEGDLFVYLPEAGVLFTSDLVFNDAIGPMGDGHMREWVINLEMLESMEARVVVPGVGGVTNSAGIKRFRLFLKDFLTEVLRHQEQGETLKQTKKGFRLPQYEKLPGYKAFSEANVERAYGQLQELSKK